MKNTLTLFLKRINSELEPPAPPLCYDAPAPDVTVSLTTANSLSAVVRREIKSSNSCLISLT